MGKKQFHSWSEPRDLCLCLPLHSVLLLLLVSPCKWPWFHLFFITQYSREYPDHIFFSHLLINEQHLSWLHLLAYMNFASINKGGQISPRKQILFSLDTRPVVRWLGHMVGFFFFSFFSFVKLSYLIASSDLWGETISYCVSDLHLVILNIFHGFVGHLVHDLWEITMSISCTYFRGDDLVLWYWVSWVPYTVWILSFADQHFVNVSYLICYHSLCFLRLLLIVILKCIVRDSKAEKKMEKQWEVLECWTHMVRFLNYLKHFKVSET